MKYRLLTKEQLEALHLEFAQFLATQQIDAKEWESLKKNKPELAAQELTLFSDLVWDDVLTKCEYIEHISDNYLNLFKCTTKEMVRLTVKWQNTNKSFLRTTDFNWFQNHPLNQEFEYFKAIKKYTSDRNTELFDLIEKGSVITNGTLFNEVLQLIER